MKVDYWNSSEIIHDLGVALMENEAEILIAEHAAVNGGIRRGWNFNSWTWSY